MVVFIQTSFATVADLQARTKVTYSGADIDWVQTLLNDATEHLRDIVGWQAYPTSQVSYTTKLQAGMFHRFPQHPAVIGTVSYLDASGPVPAAPDVFNGGFVPSKSGIATVTFTAGYSAPPPSLTSWCCVLAAQVIDAVTKLGMLGNGGLSSVSIDDFKLVWSQSAENGLGGYTLPDRVVQQLRASYGTTAYVTGSA
jgi:hypothetical protein